jgi:hypothetical protein
MKDVSRRVKNVEKRLNLNEKPKTGTIGRRGGKVPPDRTEGNINGRDGRDDEKGKLCAISADEETLAKSYEKKTNDVKLGSEMSKAKGTAKLTVRQLKAIPHIGAAATYTEGCEKAKIKKTTVYMWIKKSQHSRLRLVGNETKSLLRLSGYYHRA